MSSYFDGKQLFNEPVVEQHSSHMLMKNIHKPEKVSYITLDSAFSLNEDLSKNVTKWDFKLSDPIQEVKELKITSATIPLSWYNIAENLNNSYFSITVYKDDTLTTKHVIKVDDDEYLEGTLIENINEKITALITEPGSKKPVFVAPGNSSKPGVKITVDNSGGGSTYHYIIDFSVDKYGNSDKRNPKSKLGYHLGFRRTTYNTKNGDIEAEKFIDIAKRLDVYLSLEDYTTGYSSNYTLVKPDGQTRDNIIAKIRVDPDDIEGTKQYGTSTGSTVNERVENALHKLRTLSSNLDTIVTGTRTYSGKTTLQKMTLILKDKFGNYIDLNGLDFDISMEIKHL